MECSVIHKTLGSESRLTEYLPGPRGFQKEHRMKILPLCPWLMQGKGPWGGKLTVTSMIPPELTQ